MIMKDSILLQKSKAFASRIMRHYKHLHELKEPVIARKMLRAGTAIGANVAESLYAHSQADFASKLQIALKEAAETEYWLEILHDADLIGSDPAFASICDDCMEIITMLTACVNTVKSEKPGR